MSPKKPAGEPTPHDKYFRYVFQQPEPARDLVRNVLRMEPSLVGVVGDGGSGDEGAGDPAGREAPRDPIVSLTPHSPSFVDEKLREHRSDLLVTLGTASGRELAVYMLFEHKARNEEGTIYRLIRYNAMALAYLAKKRGRQRRGPPPIVSVVVYNGPGTWRAPTTLGKVLDTGSNVAGSAATGSAGSGDEGIAGSNVAAGSGALEQLHQFRYLVFDVGLGLSEELVGGPLTRTALQVMYAASRKLGREGVRAVVHSLTQPAIPEAFREASFRYLSAGREDNVESIFATLQQQEYTEMGAPMISFIEKKHREGIAEGKADTLTRLLERKFGLDSTDLQWVRQVTDIPKLQAALDEIIEPEATAESVLSKLG